MGDEQQQAGGDDQLHREIEAIEAQRSNSEVLAENAGPATGIAHTIVHPVAELMAHGTAAAPFLRAAGPLMALGMAGLDVNAAREAEQRGDDDAAADFEGEADLDVLEAAPVAGPLLSGARLIHDGASHGLGGGPTLGQRWGRMNRQSGQQENLARTEAERRQVELAQLGRALPTGDGLLAAPARPAVDYRRILGAPGSGPLPTPAATQAARDQAADFGALDVTHATDASMNGARERAILRQLAPVGQPHPSVQLDLPALPAGSPFAVPANPSS